MAAQALRIAATDRQDIGRILASAGDAPAVDSSGSLQVIHDESPPRTYSNQPIVLPVVYCAISVDIAVNVQTFMRKTDIRNRPSKKRGRVGIQEKVGDH